MCWISFCNQAVGDQVCEIVNEEGHSDVFYHCLPNNDYTLLVAHTNNGLIKPKNFKADRPQHGRSVIQLTW